ncbi:hypothetical protein AAMO2058_000446700 [Amorphochlora amoebiformis]
MASPRRSRSNAASVLYTGTAGTDEKDPIAVKFGIWKLIIVRLDEKIRQLVHWALSPRLRNLDPKLKQNKSQRFLKPRPPSPLKTRRMRKFESIRRKIDQGRRIC